MKKLLPVFIIILMVCPVFSATIITKSGQTLKGEVINKNDDSISVLLKIDMEDIQSIDETSDFVCPEKKVPVKPGNFEIIQGNAVPFPANISSLKRAVFKALKSHGYTILSDEPGIITYMLKKDDYDCTVRFCYCPNEYWYEYVDSTNLDANPAKNKIHRSYCRWINILEEDISDLYW